MGGEGRALGPWSRPAHGLREVEAGRAEEKRLAEKHQVEDAPPIQKGSIRSVVDRILAAP